MAHASLQLPQSLLASVASCILIVTASCADEEAAVTQPEGTLEDQADPASRSPAASAPPRPLPAALKLVYRAILSQRFEEARELAREYLQLHPGDAQATLMIGLSHFKADNHGAARPYLEQALALDPDYYITHDYLAEALFHLGDLDGARGHYETFSAFVPTEPKTFVRLGIIELEESHLDRAMDRFNQALEVFDALEESDPRTFAGQRAEIASLHARLGDVHFARDDYEAARDELLEATRIWPGNISAFFTLSLVYRRLGQEALADVAAQRYESARRAIIETQENAKR